MDKHSTNTYIVCLLLLICHVAHAQERGYLEQYSTDRGLSDNFVSAIVQDTSGFLWVGTQSGLCRFDGKQFKIFSTDNYPVLGRNDITSLCIDGGGRLLSGSRNSVLVRYNREMDTFDDLGITDIYGTEFASVSRLSEQAGGALYALTTSGLYRYGKQKDRFINHGAGLDSTTRFPIQDLHIDSQRRYWIGTGEGVRVLDSTGAELALFCVPRNSKSEFFSFGAYSDSVLFIGSSTDGLWMVNTSLPIAETHPRRVRSPFAEVSCFLRSAGKCFIGTRSQGLWTVAEGLPAFTPQSFIPLYPDLKAVNCMCEDRNGDLWLGTQGAGIYCYRMLRSSAILQSRNVGFPQAIVSSFAQDDAGRLWVGTDGDGMYLLSPDYRISKRVSIQSGLSSNGILSLASGRGALWAATWGGGICKIDSRDYTVETWTAANSAMPINNSKSVCVTRSGEVWAGTHGEGLCLLDKVTGRWLSHRSGAPQDYALLPAPWVNQVIEGTGGVLWIATIRNVFRKEGAELQITLRDTGAMPLKNPLFVNAIAANAQGEIFAATNRGIYYISADGKHFTMQDYIPQGEYFSVFFDLKGRCWFVGASGVSYCEAGKRSVHRISLPSASFRGNYFTPRAAYITAQGRIFLGTVNGFMSFHPDSLPSAASVDNISFSDIYISSERQLPGSEFLPRHLSCTPKLTLAYNQTNIRIAFDVVSLDNPEDVHSAYMLAGIDRQWTRTGDEREVSFSQIPPGMYTLRIKAWRGADESRAKTVSLTLVVTPPWWKTWWFILISASAMLLIVAAVIRMRFKRVLAQTQRLEAQVSERTQELRTAYQEINAQNISLSEHQLVIEMKNEELSRTLSTKDRLLSIIAHDLKNPMFAIVMLLELLQKRFDDLDNDKKLKFISNALDSARLLQNEMVKLLEWATLQHRDQVFKPQETGIGAIVCDTISLLSQTADSKGITILFEPVPLPNIYVDARMIATVIRNLIGNAIKFTPQGGTITVIATQHGETVQVSVQDSGVGMTPEQIASLFAPDTFASTRGTNSEKGTGLGLKICHEFVLKNNGTIAVESMPGNGSTFTISLPAATGQTIPAPLHPAEAEDKPAEPLFAIDRTLLDGNTVLIIDDNAAIRQRLHDIIGQYASVLEASDGAEGYAFAISQKPDIILSDVDMPEMDGLDLCRKIAESDKVSHIPIVLLTARSEQAHKLAGLQSGAVDYLTKPFNETELLMKLSNILTVRRRQQQKLMSLSHTQAQMPDEVHPFVARLCEIIEQNYRNADLTVDDLAREMAMSKTTLWRRLSSIIDKSPNELLNEHRLRRARTLLQDKVLNVSEAAYEVGFSDPRYFSRRFKELFGQSPSDV